MAWPHCGRGLVPEENSLSFEAALFPADRVIFGDFGSLLFEVDVEHGAQRAVPVVLQRVGGSPLKIGFIVVTFHVGQGILRQLSLVLVLVPSGLSDIEVSGGQYSRIERPCETGLVNFDSRMQ